MIENFVRPDFSSSVQMTDDIMAKNIENRRLWLRLATEWSTMPLTILAALEEFYPNIASMDRLTLHIVGLENKNLHPSPPSKGSAPTSLEAPRSGTRRPQMDGQFPQGG
jgi:hypothetical protein